MIDQQIEIPTKDGHITTFISHPERGGPHPVIIFYMDAPGIREELRNMCRRIAKMGYFVLLPDLFYRLGTIRLDVPRRDDHMANVFTSDSDRPGDRATTSPGERSCRRPDVHSSPPLRRFRSHLPSRSATNGRVPTPLRPRCPTARSSRPGSSLTSIRAWHRRRRSP